MNLKFKFRTISERAANAIQVDPHTKFIFCTPGKTVKSPVKIPSLGIVIAFTKETAELGWYKYEIKKL